MERILGKIVGKEKGPLVLCVAGIHGNEQIGLHAFRNVYSAIQNHNIGIKGTLIGICGNIPAIASNRRFIDFDLNRVWKEELVASILSGSDLAGVESEQVRALHELIARESSGNFDLMVLADLHATSSDNGNFVVVPEIESNHPVIEALKLPVVLEIDKYLEGTLLSYYQKKGFVSFAFEGGTIGTKDVYKLHTSGLWEILDKAGMISHHDHKNEDHYSALLRDTSSGLPEKVSIIYHHKVKPTDEFRMLPGYKNFQKIHQNELLAIDVHGDVLAPADGMIFMSLYQSEGDDGFFIVEEVKAKISL